MINVYKKKSEVQLNAFLNSREMDCQCSSDRCAFTLVEERSATSFYKVRVSVGRPLHISSGYRCQKHNEDVGGVPMSKHTLGHAMDIVIPSDIYDDKEELDKFINICKTHYDVVIPYIPQRFLHCHNEPLLKEI